MAIIRPSAASIFGKPFAIAYRNLKSNNYENANSRDLSLNIVRVVNVLANLAPSHNLAKSISKILAQEVALSIVIISKDKFKSHLEFGEADIDFFNISGIERENLTNSVKRDVVNYLIQESLATINTKTSIRNLNELDAHCDHYRADVEKTFNGAVSNQEKLTLYKN
ncbi:hypothetical protein GEMRC1_001204 [Eukaryota sp. GEM-RC1]